MKSKISILIAMVVVLTFSAIGFAAVKIEKVEAYLAHDMGFRVDGAEWQPQDLDGSVLTPIIYNNRSYVPVRALLEEKEVEVDFDNDTRTIILNYPVKELDKSTPLLIQARDLDSDGDGIPDLVEMAFAPNKEYESLGLPFTSEITLDLSDDVEIFLKGRKLSLEELVKADENISLGFGEIKVKYEPQKSAVTSIQLEAGSDETLAAKADISIEISGPPFKIKIIIKF